jgi:hypothetical protein
MNAQSITRRLAPPARSPTTCPPARPPARPPALPCRPRHALLFIHAPGGTRSAALNFPLVANPTDGTTGAALRRELDSLLAFSASGHAFPDDAIVVKSRAEVAEDCRAFDASVSLKVAMAHAAQRRAGKKAQQQQQEQEEGGEDEAGRHAKEQAAAAFLQE